MTKRLILVIALVTFLALIAVWQKVQTIRFGYQISESTQVKKQLLRQNTFFTIQLTQSRSPDHLVTQAKTTKLTLFYPATTLIGINQKPELINYSQLVRKP